MAQAGDRFAMPDGSVYVVLSPAAARAAGIARPRWPGRSPAFGDPSRAPV